MPIRIVDRVIGSPQSGIGGLNPSKFTYTGNASTTAFNIPLSAFTSNPANYRVEINGVTQEPVIDYFLSGSNIVFTSAPLSSEKIVIVANNIVGAYDFNLPDGSVTTAKLANNAITTSKLASNAITQEKIASITATGTLSARSLQDRFADVVNVKDFGAVGDGVTNDTAAIQAAIDYAGTAAGFGRVVFIPAGRYRVTSTIYIRKNESNSVMLGVNVVGAGKENTTIIAVNPAYNVFQFQACQYCGIEGMTVISTGTVSSGYCVAITVGSSSINFHCYIKEMYIVYMYNGILVDNGTEARISNCNIGGLVGVYGIRFAGTGSFASGLGSTRLVVDDVVSQGIGVAGNNTNFIHYSQDSYSASLVLNKCTALYGRHGFVMSDSANITSSPYSRPLWCYAHDLECDHNDSIGVLLNGGEGFYCINSWIGSSSNGSGVVFGTPFAGESVMTNTRIMGNGAHGVVLNPGPKDIYIQNSIIGTNSILSPGTYHGVAIQGNASYFNITNNKIGDTVGVLLTSQAYGVFVSNGVSENYIISNNTLTGNLSGGLLLGSQLSGTGFIKNNLGYTPTNETFISSLIPTNDNSQTLGIASKRWSVVYAGTGTINTSDEREKQQIETIDEAVFRAWSKVQFKQFKFNDAVAIKGNEDARVHIGFIAQKVKEAFESEGLDAFKYGLLCYDTWENGNRYGIRYEEALALECAYQRRIIENTAQELKQLKRSLGIEI